MLLIKLETFVRRYSPLASVTVAVYVPLTQSAMLCFRTFEESARTLALRW